MLNVYKIGYTKVRRPDGSGQDGVKSVAAVSPNAATDALRLALTESDENIDVNFNSVQEIAKDILLPLVGTRDPMKSEFSPLEEDNDQESR